MRPKNLLIFFTSMLHPQLLGYSRPYVAMLIDQDKLKGATVSDGGHRRANLST
jgi:hypothetical protein